MEIFCHMDAKAFSLKIVFASAGAANNRVLTKFLISRQTGHSFTEAMFFPKLKGRGPNTTTMDLGPGTLKLPQHSTAPESRAAIFPQGLRELLILVSRPKTSKDRATKDLATQDQEPNVRQPIGQAVGVSGGLQCGATDLCSRRL